MFSLKANNRDFTKRNSILLVYSDVNASPQLLSIVKTLESEDCLLRVVLIGDNNLRIAQDILSQGISLKMLSRRGKYLSIVLFWSVWLEVIKHRPKALYASGQFASAVGMVCSSLFRIPTRVFSRHHSSFHHKYNMKFGIFVDRLTNKLATHVVAVSTMVQKILVVDEAVPERKISIIPNGIDLSSFLKVRSKDDGDINGNRADKDRFKVGIVSRMTDWKGVEYGAKAFTQFLQKFPNAHLTIIGAFSDSYEKVCEILKPLPAESYKLEEVRLDIPVFLSDLDIFIHTPIGSQDEAFGIVYIEALAAGIPSVFTKSGALHDFTEIQNYAEIVPYMNSEAIFEAMLRISNNLSPANSMMPEELLKNYSLDLMGRRYSNLILGNNIS